LPLYVPDAGKKAVAPLENNGFGVTSGTHVKFARTGELALQNIAQTVLDNVRRCIFSHWLDRGANGWPRPDRISSFNRI